MAIRLLIADDHHIVRRGLAFFLKTQKNIEIIGEASNGQEAVSMAEAFQPDVILMDLDMPVMNGIEATREITKRSLPSKIMILTSFSDQDHVIPAIEAGAAGYQLKDVQPDVLVQAIEKLVKGENEIHPKATAHLLKQLSQRQSEQNELNVLTKREKDVLREIAAGKSNKEIAAALFITEKTVKTHVSNLLSKLQVTDRTQAALLAVRLGIHKY
ncbi:response regulator [Cytobacillus gottheilii]|uniref:Response regulator transcription factor n=1 Tax=Cytobacillus gottheilii TaxID=859144 RepID=A0ABX8FFF6_9BACI|nr:response regulator transcription factor [Cytobacillus gottheilii]QVY62724.1 response regulator transcription factor [Cytobacillus gottheilii]